jgi:hypothetical protein
VLDRDQGSLDEQPDGRRVAECRTTVPSSGSGESAVIPASWRARELTQRLWQLSSRSRTGRPPAGLVQGGEGAGAGQRRDEGAAPAAADDPGVGGKVGAPPAYVGEQPVEVGGAVELQLEQVGAAGELVMVVHVAETGHDERAVVVDHRWVAVHLLEELVATTAETRPSRTRRTDAHG